jgi:hypothetical protein
MTPVQDPALPAAVPAVDRPPARILLGLGDGQLEHTLMAGCAEAGHTVVRRCLAAEELLAAARAHAPDLIVASANLHRLDGAALAELLLPGSPVVLLADERLPHGLRLLFPEPRAALDVGEQEGDGAGGQIGHGVPPAEQDGEWSAA